MNHHLKPVVTAIGAIAFVLPFTLADFAWSQAPTNRQIAVEPSDEKKPADGAQADKADAKAKEDAPAKKAEEAAGEKKPEPETDKAEAKKEAPPARPDKAEAKKEAPPGKAEAKKEGAPGEPGQAEAKKEGAPGEPGQAKAKKEGAPGEPGKAAAKKEGPPEKLGPKDLALALQSELKRVGCYYGALDGVWGRRSIDALHAFGYFGKIKTNNFKPSEAWIGRVKGKAKTVCKGNNGYGRPSQGYGPGYGGPGYGGPPPGGYQGGYGGYRRY